MSRAQGFQAGIFLFETIAGPKHWMLGTCAWSYWHGIMVWVILNRERERAIEISSAREEGANGGAKRKEREW